MSEEFPTEMRDRVRSAPKLFARAAIILDFGGLSDCPDASTVKALIEGLRDAGVLPIGIAYGTSAIEAVAGEVGLPLLAKFRASYEYGSAAAAPDSTSQAADKPRRSRSRSGKEFRRRAASGKATGPASGRNAEPGLMHVAPVRSGQQVYAQNRDLTVCATVGAGAEVIADGSIHIYGALRGRALAGASGLASARIFCREFNAELVAIAGTYKVLEEVPKQLHRQSRADLAGKRQPSNRRAGSESNLRHPWRTILTEIIVVTSGKGGVGKTTTSASIACGLAQSRQEDRRHRLRRRPAQPRPDHGLRASRGVRLRQRRARRGLAQAGADQGQALREPATCWPRRRPATRTR